VKRRSLLLVAAALLAGCGGESGDAGSPDLSNPEEAMLRLADLPAGYVQSGEYGCGPFISTEGASPRIDELLRETRPRGCTAEFRSAWRDRGSARSAVFSFSTVEDARSGWALREELFLRFGAVSISQELPTDHPGDEAVRFDSEGGAGLAWRDGPVLAVVYGKGSSAQEGRRFAAELARKQDSRIHAPEPLPDTERGREVGLDDPSIAVPVYWLGRQFEPPGLPALELYEGVHLAGEHGPGNEVKIDYQGEGLRFGVSIDCGNRRHGTGSRRPVSGAWSGTRPARGAATFASSAAARRSTAASAPGRVRSQSRITGLPTSTWTAWSRR
jgi:hypothetical protein